jgi:hypothetical protein
MIEHVIVSIDVMTKGITGVLIPLGFDSYVSADTAIYLYNLISIALIMFIAGFSSQKSEAAFCVITPLMAGMFIFFGWFRTTNPAEQSGLIVLTIICGLLGIFIYMNEQNRVNYGSGGPGSKLINVALMLALFTASFTLVSDFNILPDGNPMPPAGTCVAGMPCDAYSNIDFTTTSAQFQNNGGLGGDIISSATGLASAIPNLLIMIMKMLVGIFLFSVVLNSIIGGLYPGIVTNGMYVLFLSVMNIVILAIYALGVLELYRGSPGSTI